MKVLYNACFADPWVKVAQKLKKYYNYEPIYWVGYEDDNSCNIVPETFPEAIYHPYFDAWAGKFPEIIEKADYDFNLNIDLLKNYASEELQAYKMMDRMDPYRNCFSFMERQAHFRKLLRYWEGVMDILQLDMVISASIPHRVYDYALYLVCKQKNIPFLSFSYTHFFGQIIPLKSCNTIGDRFSKEYNELANSDKTINEIEQLLIPEVSSYFERVKLDYSKGKPKFVSIEEVKDKKSSGAFSLAIKFFKDVFVTEKDRYIGKEGILRNGMPSYVKINRDQLTTRLSLYHYSKMKMLTNRYKKELNKRYDSLAWEPDFKQKYVLYNLHYQPEATTSPGGDIFVDSNIILDALSKNLPDDYLIYVKEHPAQFHSHREGHTNRIMSYYDNLLLHKKVRIIPLHFDPFKLIRSAEAVATIGGSVGWEAMALGKPVISFGLSWYENYNGVYKVKDEASASKIFQFIKSFKFDERDLVAYLAAFGQKSIKAYYYRGLKKEMNLSEEECINNLTNSILEMSKEMDL